MAILNKETIEEQAQRLWPNSEVLQQKWLEAIKVTKSTKKGWLLDAYVAKRDVAA